MSAGPPAVSRGPAGRGRGTSMPAWMTAGIGASATAAIDSVAPSIPQEGEEKADSEDGSEDLLASTFAERDVSAIKNLKAKTQSRWVKGGGGAKKLWGNGGGGGAKKTWGKKKQW